MSVDLTKGATVELVKTLSDDIRMKADGSKANSSGAAIREQFTDLKTDIQYYDFSAEYSQTLDGRYMSDSGSHGYSSDYEILRYIKLNNGDKITVSTIAESNVVVIGRYNTTTSFTNLVTGSSAFLKTYEYIATENMFVGVSLNKNTESAVSISRKETILTDSTKYMFADIKPVLSDNLYIGYADGGTASLEGWSVSDYVSIAEGDTIALINYSDRPMSGLFGLAFYSENMQFIENSGIQLNGTDVYIQAPADAAYFRYTIYTDNADLYTLMVNRKYYHDVEETYYPSVSMFPSIGVIGDSYASGEIYDSTSTNKGDFYYVSWPQVLARRNGITAENYSRGGLTSSDWLTSPYGLTKLQNSDPNDLYAIVLGINDVYSILPSNPNYIGSASDIGTEADTLWNNMYKIITAIKTKNAYAKVIIIGLAPRPDGNTTWQNRINIENAGLEDIAEYLNIPYISESDIPYFNSYEYKTAMLGGHPTATGYSMMAKAMEQLIEKCIKSNQSYFIDYPWGSE